MAWKWNKKRYAVAEEIALGKPIKDIAHEYGISRYTIYKWLNEPEFSEYVDRLVYEFGAASKRERFIAIKQITEIMKQNILTGLAEIPMTEKTMSAYLSNYLKYLEHLAKEKGELTTKHEVKTNPTADVSRHVLTGTYQVEELLNNSSESQREKLEKELDKIGDEIIRKLSGW